MYFRPWRIYNQFRMIIRSKGQSKGIIFILISAFFYASYGVWSRIMSHGFGEFSQAWTRGLILTLVILLINLKFKILKPIKRRDLPWFIIIALAGGLNQAPYFFGFKHLNIGTATLLFYAALVVGGYFIGKLFFEEHLSKTKVISLVLSIIGISTIYRLSLRPDQFLAAALTIIAGLMGACSAVLPKKLSGEYEELQIMSGYFWVMFIVNGILAAVFKDSYPEFRQFSVWGAQFGYAIAMLLANWAVIEGFKYIEASIGSLIGLAEIIFGISFGILLFGESLTIGTILGSGLIITSAILPNLKNPKSIK